MKYILNFRDKKVGGAVLKGTLENTAGLGNWDDLNTEKEIIFLIHGFNVGEDDGREKLIDFANLLGLDSKCGLVSVLWPGDHFLNAISYPFEGRDADDTSRELIKFIKDLNRDIRFSFVAHSLGNRVAMNTADFIRKDGRNLGQMCLMAAAIDDYSLANRDDYFYASSHAERIAVLTSRKDKVLKFAYPVGDLFQAFLFIGDTLGFALGLRGPKARRRKKEHVPENVYHVPISKSRKCDHGDYLPSNPPNQEQLSAAVFAKKILSGTVNPKYK